MAFKIQCVLNKSNSEKLLLKPSASGFAWKQGAQTELRTFSTGNPLKITHKYMTPDMDNGILSGGELFIYIQEDHDVII